MRANHRIPVTIAVLLTALLIAEPAEALRCGNKLVKDGMHEAEVIAICGEPSSVRSLGYVLRYIDPVRDNIGSATYTVYHGYGARQELLVTEMLYNFGPHKLIRILRFEGGRLTSIETAGYGYREK